MGRHSAPDPDDFLDEPSPDHPVDERDDAYAFDAQGAPDEGYYPDERRYPDADFVADDYAPEEFAPGEDLVDEDPDDYPEFPSRRPAPSGPQESPASAPSLRARRLDWRGGHRSEGGRRGVSIGVIVALVAVVVVVGSVILWRFFGDALSSVRTPRPGAASAARSRSRSSPTRRSPTPSGNSPRASTSRPARSAITAWWSASSRPAPTPCSTASSASGPRNSVGNRHCGFRAARSPRRGWPAPPPRRPSPRAIRWPARRWCWPSARNCCRPCRVRTGRHCPGCRPTRMRWRD